MSTSLDQILKFVDFLHRFRAVERRLLSKGQNRNENDAEHSFNLSLLAWYINNTYNLKLDIEKIFKYALAHDLVEAYAGDTFCYDQSEYLSGTKKDRELQALAKIKLEFAEFVELTETIDAYEQRLDPESLFIYALDKIEPVFNTLLDGGKTWRREEITLEMLIANKTPKVALNDTVKQIFDELVERLKAEEKDLFGNN